MDTVGEHLHKTLTYLKAIEPDIQEQINRSVKYKTDMGLSVAAAGVAALILECERLGGHDRLHNLQQFLDIVAAYVEHGGPAFQNL